MSYILGFDTETTGVNPDKGDRIIEIALIKYSPTGEKLDEYIRRFDPEHPIHPDAQAVHGIAYADLVGQPKFAELAPEIYDLISGASLLVAHNIEFDANFLTAEFVRAEMKVPQTVPFCTMQNSRWACYDGKLPKLAEVCFALGIEYDVEKAHAADYDVLVMMDAFFKACERGLYTAAIAEAVEAAA